MIVYHYCSLESLNSILKNRSLRLTNILKSNDSMEISWICRYYDAEFKRAYENISIGNVSNISYTSISDIIERQMKDMKRKLSFRKVVIFLILALFLTAGISMRAVTVNAAAYVKQDRTSVSITSKKTGWKKINGDYYFYNSKGRLICGSFKYKGYYYYSIANGKRFTGWMKRSGNKYY